jgi:RNA polymerase nonessential primary-like sigma factor
MATPIPPGPDQDEEGENDASESEHTFSVVAGSPENTEHTFTGSLGSVRYGSVQAWYVRAVEGAPRLTAKGEQLVRDRLRRTQYDMSVALGTSPSAVHALVTGFAKIRGAPTRGYFLRWPTTDEAPWTPAEVMKRVEVAQDALDRLKSSASSAERDALLEQSISTLFSLRPSDEAIRGVLTVLTASPDSAVQQEIANIRGAQRALQIARNKIIDPHLRIVLRELRRHMSSGGERRELLQEGNLGLLKAAEVYDESRDVPFSAYALTWVRSRMKRAVLRQRSQLHLPDRFRREVSEVRRLGREMSSNLGREPTLDELARKSGYELERLRRMLVRNALSTAFTSLQAAAGSDEGPGLDESLADPGDLSAVDLLEERELLTWLEPALGGLDERQRKVLELRFGLAETAPHTLSEAGKKLGVSAERVRQIEVKALEALAAGLEP